MDLKIVLYEAGRKFEIHHHQRSLGVQLGQLEQIKCKNKTSAYICKKCLLMVHSGLFIINIECNWTKSYDCVEKNSKKAGINDN